jgi:hypothetical protein
MARPARSTSLDAATPVARLLAAAAGELNALASLSQQLHELVERQHAAAGLSDACVEDAQIIDYLVQHLDALALFLTLVAEQAPNTVHVDAGRALAGLPLGDLARRLGGGAAAAPAPTGDLELF